MQVAAVNSATAPISQSDAVTAPMLPAMHRPWPYPILDADVTRFHVFTEDEVEEELEDKAHHDVVFAWGYLDAELDYPARNDFI